MHHGGFRFISKFERIIIFVLDKAVVNVKKICYINRSEVRKWVIFAKQQVVSSAWIIGECEEMEKVYRTPFRVPNLTN